MSPDYELNEAERAENFLAYVKEKYIISASDETNLFNLLKDYFVSENASPALSAGKKREINRIVKSLKLKI